MTSMLLLQGSASHLPLRDESVQCVVTSPPYFGSVRVYQGAQTIPGWGCVLGEERNPSEYAVHLVEVFREVRRVLRRDGTVWLNIGDVYAASGKGGGGIRGARATNWSAVVTERKGFRMPPAGYKQKDITSIPFTVVDALRADGWYHRATIIWSKPCAVEPKRLDRPSLSHEYLFMLSRSEQYAARDPGEAWWQRSVWDISPVGSAEHPAMFPDELPRRCIVSSSKPGDVVLDPFNGSGTTGRVAIRHGRSYVGLDISREYLAEQATKRIDNIQHVMDMSATAPEERDPHGLTLAPAGRGGWTDAELAERWAFGIGGGAPHARGEA